jgi:NADH pyrophosphatase NudC (nudix superfamily)
LATTTAKYISASAAARHFVRALSSGQELVAMTDYCKQCGGPLPDALAEVTEVCNDCAAVWFPEAYDEQ